ncbi:unnamed protein product, partial [Polarella glacialis]
MAPVSAAAAGPAADFGSLSTFLGVSAEGHDGTRRPKDASSKASQVQQQAAANSLPGRPLKDRSQLNKKVAFKMLKQLGCEVRRAEPPEGEGGVEGEAYIEIPSAEQPVLFKMLLEFGYRPQRCPESGQGVIRVVEVRQRRPEELAASLAAPRRRAQKEPDEDEGWPSVGNKPRLRPEEEQELVNRLARPRIPRPPVAPSVSASDASEAGSGGKGAAAGEKEKPRRTAAEQRAYLNRLLRPAGGGRAGEKEEDLPSELAAAAAAAGMRFSNGVPQIVRAKPTLTWPVPAFSSNHRSASVPGEASRAGRPAARSASPAGCPAPPPVPPPAAREAFLPPSVRPSPRLAQAGLSALGGRLGVVSSPSPSNGSGSVRSASPATVSDPGARPGSADFGMGGEGSRRTSPLPTLPTGCDEFAATRCDDFQSQSETVRVEAEPATAEAEEEDSVAHPEPPPEEEEEEPFRRSHIGATEARQQRRHREKAASPTDESTGDWLDRLLGPVGEPAQALQRTKAEQRVRLEQLAKPRQKPEPKSEENESRPPRSPRSQREACNRLAQPRKPVATGGKPDAEDLADDWHDADADSDEDVGDPDWAPAVPGNVKIIPSLLAQCPSRLERIDEDGNEQASRARASAARERERARAGERARGGERARSQGATPYQARSSSQVAAPYAAPVVPKAFHNVPAARSHGGYSARATRRERESRGREAGRQSHQEGEEEEVDEDDMSHDDLARLAELMAMSGNTEEAAQGEAMLANIDALYQQLLGGRAQAPKSQPNRPVGKEFSGVDGDHLPPAQRISSHQNQVDGHTRLEEQAGNAFPLEGEELLANIDRLYGELLAEKGNAMAAAAEVEGMGSEEEAGNDDLSHGLSRQQQLFPPQVAQAENEESAVLDNELSDENEALAELPALLEEILWSALLLGRGVAGSLRAVGCSGTAAQAVPFGARLLELLPSATLAEACMRLSQATPPGEEWLPPSLWQRLAAELPELHAAVAGGGAPAKKVPALGAPVLGAATTPSSEAPSRSLLRRRAASSEASEEPERSVTTAALVRAVREARDGLLAAASSPRADSAEATPKAPLPPPPPKGNSTGAPPQLEAEPGTAGEAR